MKFVSTRGQSPGLGVSEAMQRGLAPDGGLFVPEVFPRFEAKDFEKIDSFPRIAAKVLAPFFSGDPLESELDEICDFAFSFPIPLRELRDQTAVLELFHGPSAAFKDVGARFLAECFSRLNAREKNTQEKTILVATSGDTGGAVAAAFYRKPNVKVVILFPKDGVSERQRRQLTCWGENVLSLAVHGTFDDCQRLVKEALADSSLRSSLNLSSANSINIGRLLPQMAYYVAACCWYYRAQGRRPAFSIPSGNIGNATGAFWAKSLGMPIRQIALATNANRAVQDYFETGEWKPRASVPTLANAMDVGNPSNMERVVRLYPQGASALRQDALSLAVDDETIEKTITEGERRWGEIWCPHTATAVRLRETQSTPDWIIVATAHPAKFEGVVEPLIGHPIAIPPHLAELLVRPTRFSEIETDFQAFRLRLLE